MPLKPLKKENQPFDEIKKAWQELANILEAVVDPIIFANFDGKIEQVNNATSNLLGFGRSDILGKGLSKIFYEDSFSEGSNIHLLITKGLLKDHETCLVAEGGEEIAVLLSGSPVRDYNSRLLGYVLLAKDIRSMKKAEELKSEIISTVSHELRTPLAIMKGAIDNLKDGIVGAVSQKQNEVLSTVMHSIRRLERLVNDLLDVSRLEANVKIKWKPVDLTSLIQRLVQSSPEQKGKLQNKIACEFKKSLPDCCGDRAMIEQVVLNLINNALRFSIKSVTVTAGLNLKPEDTTPHLNNQFLEIAVIDDGPGIATGNQSRLFKKFEQLDRPEGGAGYKGTGLGLAICKGIIEKHNGKIWVESKIGEGSKFMFTLPVCTHSHANGPHPDFQCQGLPSPAE
jgi:PAS domain S-box-containing protein